MDFLGLRNLDVIDKAVELVGGVDIGSLPLDDEKTYAMLARGDSTGVFQFESSGMREALRSVKPTEFEDLIALVALYRPGPMGYIPMYAARKNGREQVSYADPRLEAITGQTYAICIYQEQYMQIAKELAGFSPAEAETLRKAIGKKIHSLMASLKDKFLEGCAENQVAPAVAQQLWKDMESSQDYSFNKAHAACYALIAYRTAWLKANHPKEYMAALISSVMNTKDRVPLLRQRLSRDGHRRAAAGRELVAAGLRRRRRRHPLRAERGQERGGGGCRRDRPRPRGGWAVRVDLGAHRARRPAVPQQARARVAREVRRARLDRRDADRACSRLSTRSLGHGQRISADRLAGQASIFDGAFGEDDQAVEVQHPPLATTEFDERELLRLEKETLGLYVSEHPLERVRAELKRKTDCALTDIERRRDGEFVTVGGIVSGLKQVTTKRGEPMVFVTLDDPTGSAEVVVFNSTYAAARELLEADRILVVKGRVDHKQAGETKLVASEVSAFESALDPPRGPAPHRRASGAGGAHPRARDARRRLPRRRAGLPRARDVARRADARARPRVPREARGGLLRRGARAARRGSDLVASADVRLAVGVAAQPLAHAGEHLQGDRRHRLDDRTEATVGDDEHVDRRRRRDGGSAGLSVMQRDLAEPVARAEVGDLLALLRHLGGSVDQHEELPTRAAFAREHGALSEVELVRDLGELRATRSSSSPRRAGPSSAARSSRHGGAPRRHPRLLAMRVQAGRLT